MVFARKPAPILVSWAGYVGTTGLDAIDYCLSDYYSTLDQEETFYSEKIIRMPNTWLCYTPPDYAPAIGSLPKEVNGYTTFGSFSNPAKINGRVLTVWAKILRSVPNSRLLIKYRGTDADINTQRIKNFFIKEEIDISRLTLEGHAPHGELLARYNHVDIALDPFPYSGGLTTLEALWMGVPVITLPGATFASRHSLSFLSALGLSQLIANTEKDYIEISADLANNIDTLMELRSVLRNKMSNSAICDYNTFAKDFSSLMTGVWRDWCTKIA